MTAMRSLVSTVDDNESGEFLPDLLRQFGLATQAFSPAEFRASELVSETHCLILDIAMPGMSGVCLSF